MGSRFACGTRAGRVNTCGIVACCAIVVVAFLVVAPEFLRTHNAPGNSDCQSNLMQIGRAMKLYLCDWHDTYPTNRVLLANGKFGRVASHIKLTPVGEKRLDGTPARFHYGVNWIKALFPYTEQMTKEGWSAWRCEIAGSQTFPENSNTARVSYAFSRNLIERPEEAVRVGSLVMMVREMDRLVDAELRPTNYSCGLPDVPPDAPFLTTHDSRIGPTNPELHFTGSNVLFADAHVMWFNIAFPDQRHITAKLCWDSEDQQWYNCLDRRNLEQYKRIAITP